MLESNVWAHFPSLLLRSSRKKFASRNKSAVLVHTISTHWNTDRLWKKSSTPNWTNMLLIKTNLTFE